MGAMNSRCLSIFWRNCSKMGNKKTNRIKNSSARANEKPAEQDVQSQRQIKRRYQQQDCECCVVPPVFLLMTQVASAVSIVVCAPCVVLKPGVFLRVVARQVTKAVHSYSRPAGGASSVVAVTFLQLRVSKILAQFCERCDFFFSPAESFAKTIPCYFCFFVNLNLKLFFLAWCQSGTGSPGQELVFC